MEKLSDIARTHRVFLGLSLLLLGLPRVLKLLYPLVWVEDSYYLYAGDLVARGMAPFRDFVFTQYPGVEFLLALTYKLLGTSLRSAELLTQASTFAASCGVLILGTLVAGKKVGLISAGLFAWHSLLFRYHLAEREILSLIPMCVLMGLVVSGPLTGIRKISLFFVCACLGVSLKLSFALSCMAPVLYLYGFERRREALWALGLTGLATLLITTLLLLVYREDFLWQGLLYHLAKGSNVHGLLERLKVPTLSLDLALAIGAPGLVFLLQERSSKLWGLAVSWLIPDGLLYTLISTDLWPHNYIPALPGLCLMGGLWLSEVSQRTYWHPEGSLRRRHILFVLFVPVLLMTVFPLRNLQWERGSVYGLGFIQRKEIQEISELIRSKTQPEDRILVPEYLAIASGRRLWSEDRLEAAGVIDRLRRNASTQGVWKTCREMSQEDFWEQSMGSQGVWRGALVQAIQDNRIPIVIPYVDVHLKEELMPDSGYQLCRRSFWYPVWCLPFPPASEVQ